MRPALALALLAVLAAPARASEPPPEIFAVVVGWNGGNADLPPLRFADDDAARFAAFFRGLGTPARPGRVWLLTELDERTRATMAEAQIDARPDGPPTRDAVLAALHAAAGAVARPTGARRVLYVVYAGHGLRGRVLLKPTAGAEAALTGSELRAALAGAGPAGKDAEVYVFLDACRSESLFADRGETGAADFGAAISALEERARSLSIGVLTAARNGRPAGEVTRLEAGFFSHVLGSGLAGGADADGDDVVSFGELAAFVSFHTQKLTGQIPWFDPPHGDLAARAMDHRGRRARIYLPRDAAGRFLVGAGAGRPVFAEAYQHRGRALRLTLPPGHYRVSRDSEGLPGQIATVALARDGVVDLTGATWQDQAQSRGEEDDRLRFSSPFSTDVVSTLEAGFLAGRERPAPPADTIVAIDLAVAPAPLALGGAESQIAVRAGRRLLGLRANLVASAARSTHEADGEAFNLDRLALGLVLERPFAIVAGATLAPFLGGGLGVVLRRSAGPTSGDGRSPFLEAGLRAELPLSGPSFAALSFGYGARWIAIDGRHRRSGAPSAAAGLGVVF